MPRPLTLPFAAALGLLALLAAPSSAQAQQPDGRDDGKPWSRGILMPSLGAGGSFGGDISQLYIGAGVSYYVINGLAVGLSISMRWRTVTGSMTTSWSWLIRARSRMRL